MIERLKRLATLGAVGAACAALGGCLITNFSATQSGGLTRATATVTLQGPAPCTVDAVNGSTNCKPVMQVGTPPLGRTYQFDITLLGWTTPLALYDPVIVQVPASMSDFAGSIAAGPPGVTPGTPLQIQAGLTSIAIDAGTTLTAEPGTQFVIIDFVAPANAPSGQYTLDFEFRGTASSIKVIFAGKVTSGTATYYPPIFPCATNMSQVPAIAIPTSISAVLTTLLNVQGCVGRQYNLAAPARRAGHRARVLREPHRARHRVRAGCVVHLRLGLGRRRRPAALVHVRRQREGGRAFGSGDDLPEHGR